MTRHEAEPTLETLELEFIALDDLELIARYQMKAPGKHRASTQGSPSTAGLSYWGEKQ